MSDFVHNIPKALSVPLYASRCTCDFCNSIRWRSSQNPIKQIQIKCMLVVNEIWNSAIMKQKSLILPGNIKVIIH